MLSPAKVASMDSVEKKVWNKMRFHRPYSLIYNLTTTKMKLEISSFFSPDGKCLFHLFSALRITLLNCLKKEI